MCAVGVEETAAIGSPLFDDLLRRDRPLRDGLRGDRVHHRLALRVDRRLAIGVDVLHVLRLDEFRRVVGFEVLHHALRYQQQRSNNAKRAAAPTGVHGSDRPRSCRSSPSPAARCRE